MPESIAKLAASAAAGGLIAALALHWLTRKDTDHGVATPAVGKDSPVRTRRTSSETRPRPRDVNASAASPVRDVPPRPTAEGAAERPVPRRISGQEYGEFLQFSFEQEPIDVGWARDMERSIHGALAKLPDIRVVGAECKSVACRFEVAYGTRAAAETFETDYVQLEPFSNTGAFVQRVRGSDGKPSGAKIIFARRGHSLPTLTDDV